jgi:hypothetical protein
MHIKINIKQKGFCYVQIAVVSIILILGLVSYLITYFTGHGGLLGLLPRLDVSSEISICNYFSSLNLILASFFLYLIYLNEKANQFKGFNYWLLLSIIFLIMSIDESVGFSEILYGVQEKIENRGTISEAVDVMSIFRITIVAALAIIFFPFIKLLKKQIFRNFFIAGFVYLMGSVGFDIIGSVMLHSGIVEINDLLNLIRRLFEEGFEMFGIVIFNCTLYGLMLEKYKY